MRIEVLLLALLPLAWLLPNHYWPWVAAWQEGLALALLALYGVLQRSNTSFIDRRWCSVVLICVALVTLQWTCGQVVYGGDALMGLLYFLAFLIAITAGSQLALDDAAAPGFSAFDLFMICVLFSATLSLTIAIWQWAGTSPFSILVVDQKPGVSPYANLAQPNHFASVCILGLCAAGWLRSRNHVGALVFWGCAALMVCGVVLSGSRTGLLELLLLCVMLAGSALPVRQRVVSILMLAVLTAGLYGFWHGNDLLAARSTAEQASAGVRLPLWLQMVDAIGRHPWIGYGWNQLAMAQQLVSIDHPALQRNFFQSHNLVLDLTVWFGVPAALLLCYFAGRGLYSALRVAVPSAKFWPASAVGALLLHAMLEYPLHYAYFLLPFGILLGYLTPQGVKRVGMTPMVVRSAGAALLLLVVWVSSEYLQVEQASYAYRLKAMKLLSSTEPPVLHLHLLTQQQALIAQYINLAKEGMSAEELDAMKNVSSRYAYPLAMTRYALAAGLNGRSAEAKLTLDRLCAMHAPQRCEEARQAWKTMQSRYPQLRAIPAPNVPARAY